MALHAFMITGISAPQPVQPYSDRIRTWLDTHTDDVELVLYDGSDTAFVVLTTDRDLESLLHRLDGEYLDFDQLEISLVSPDKQSKLLAMYQTAKSTVHPNIPNLIDSLLKTLNPAECAQVAQGLTVSTLPVTVVPQPSQPSTSQVASVTGTKIGSRIAASFHGVTNTTQTFVEQPATVSSSTSSTSNLVLTNQATTVPIYSTQGQGIYYSFANMNCAGQSIGTNVSPNLPLYSTPMVNTRPPNNYVMTPSGPLQVPITPVFGPSYIHPNQTQQPIFPVYSSAPRLSPFSGIQGKSGEVDYDQWRYEVSDLVRLNYSDAHILQAMGKSLRTPAVNTLRSLGSNPTITAVLDKMDKIFGNILPAQKACKQFYALKQNDKESVAEWGCRLEDNLIKVNMKTSLTPANKAEMLRCMFVDGMRNSGIQNKIQHLYDNNKSYEELMVAARVAEAEIVTKKETCIKIQQHTNTNTGSQASTVDKTDKIDKIMKMLSNIQFRLDRVEQRHSYKDSQSSKSPSTSSYNSLAASQERNRNYTGTYSFRPNQRKETNSFKGNCWKCGKYGHSRDHCPLN